MTSDGPKRGGLCVDSLGVRISFSKKRSDQYTWDQIRRISFDDPARRSSCLGAILVMSMAACRSASLLTVSLADLDLYFQTDCPIGFWRVTAPRISENTPRAAGKIFVDGAPVDRTSLSKSGRLEQVRRLADRRDAEALTLPDFDAKKSVVLQRL
jgi:hypothetical protein